MLQMLACEYVFWTLLSVDCFQHGHLRSEVIQNHLQLLSLRTQLQEQCSRHVLRHHLPLQLLNQAPLVLTFQLLHSQVHLPAALFKIGVMKKNHFKLGQAQHIVLADVGSIKSPPHIWAS